MIAFLRDNEIRYVVGGDETKDLLTYYKVSGMRSRHNYRSTFHLATTAMLNHIWASRRQDQVGEGFYLTPRAPCQRCGERSRYRSPQHGGLGPVTLRRQR